MSELNFPNTVDELRKGLLDMGADASEVACMKKGELKERYIRLMEENINKSEFGLCDLDKSQPLSEESDIHTLEGAIGCKYGSNEWNNYVMGLFRADELWDGLPKVIGLNRVANLILGDIISSKAIDVIVSHGENKSVTVNYEIQIEWKLNTPIGFGNIGYNPQIRIFGGVACCEQDISSNFYKHPAAIAETKSFGRALRKALAINVIAAEEMLASGSEELPKAKNSAIISGPLKGVIEAKVSALKINLQEIMKTWGTDKNLAELTMEEGRDLFNFINLYQQNK